MQDNGRQREGPLDGRPPHAANDARQRSRPLPVGRPSVALAARAEPTPRDVTEGAMGSDKSLPLLPPVKAARKIATVALVEARLHVWPSALEPGQSTLSRCAWREPWSHKEDPP